MDAILKLGPLRILVATLILAVAATATVGVAAAQDAPDAACSDGIDNDADNAVDGADAGCADGVDDDETDSPSAGVVYVTVPLPVVRIAGEIRRSSVDVTTLSVRAISGNTVTVTCRRSRSCPTRKLRVFMTDTKVRISRLERVLTAPATLSIRVERPGQLGKYVRFRVRRNRAPLRTDACLDATTGLIRGCFQD